jgi:hypothetical protein
MELIETLTGETYYANHAPMIRKIQLFYKESEIDYNTKSYDLLTQSFTKYIETSIFIYKFSKFIPSGDRPSPLPLQTNVDSYCKHCSAQFQLDHQQHCSVGGRGEEIIKYGNFDQLGRKLFFESGSSDSEN